jgi:hypothetical protein
MDRLRLRVLAGPHETALALRAIVLLDGDLVEEERVVYCPFRAATTEVLECLACADFSRIHHGDTLVCARPPELTDEQAIALVEDRRICSGADSLAARTPLGAIAERMIVCATAATSIGAAEAAALRTEAHGVVVVDAARRPTAFVARARLAQTPIAARALSIAACGEETCVVLDEREPLANTLPRLIHDRQRAAVIVDDRGRVTGVVSDLDALRWLARAAHGHVSHE